MSSKPWNKCGCIPKTFLKKCDNYLDKQRTNEIDDVLKDTGVSAKHLPDLVGAFDLNELERFASTAQNHQVKFVEFLTANGINIRQFTSFDDLKIYLDSL